MRYINLKIKETKIKETKIKKTKKNIELFVSSFIFIFYGEDLRG